MESEALKLAMRMAESKITLPTRLRAGLKCKVHPRYQAKRCPRATDNYPLGCPDCWAIYRIKNRRA